MKMSTLKRDLYLGDSFSCCAVIPAEVLHVLALVLVFAIGYSFPIMLYNSCEAILDFKLLLLVLYRSHISVRLEFTVG
jgi:predicted exporter